VHIECIFREESGRILATLIRLLGSFDLAEEVMQGGIHRSSRALAQPGTAREPSFLADFDGSPQGCGLAAAKCPP
jgi:predicted RNA polymerase sigma factor